MSVLTRANHPVRLAGLFAGSVAAASIIAAAGTAVLYIVRDQRTSDVAGVSAGPQVNVDLPEGLVLLSPLTGPGHFEEVMGFAPIVPDTLPDTTDAVAKFHATQPDENGKRTGYVRFPSTGEAIEDITGPSIVLMQAKGQPGEGVDGELKRLIAANQRALIATFACGEIVVNAQFYFGPDAAAGEPFVTPYMTGVAQRFLDALRAQC